MRTLILSVVLFCTITFTSAQWTRIEAVPPTDVPSLHVSGSALFAGTDSLVFRTEDNGQNWAHSSGIPNAPIFVDALLHVNGNLYAGTGGNGIHSSTDNGVTWLPFSNGLTGLGSMYIKAIVERDEDLYCGTMGAGVFRRTDGAWVSFDDLAGMNAGNVDMLTSIGDTLWAGAGGNGFIWRSLPGTSGFEAFQVAPFQSEVHLITDIVRRGAELLIGGTYGVYRSADGGATWTWSSTGFPTSGTVQFLEKGDTLYALRSTAASFLYRSLDNGYTWQLEETMPYCYVIRVYGDRMYAARWDGLWVRDAGAVGVPPLPRTELVRVYPNPTSAGVTIERLGSAPATYRLYGVSGSVLQSGPLLEDRTELSITEFASGTYLLQVFSGDQSTYVHVVVQ